MSAETILSPAQRVLILGFVVCVALAALVRPLWLVLALNAGFTVAYVGAFVYGVNLVRIGLGEHRPLQVSDVAARAIPDSRLPTYTVLVPVYREVEVIADLVRRLDALEYPRDKLDIQVLLEEDDASTLRALSQTRHRGRLRIVRVPHMEPRTKPKACNYGLLAAPGRLITVYDAEDRPDPLQLRRAVAAFADLPPRVACLQARISYHNSNQNLLTRWFTIEYATWFGLILPALARLGGPVPLGGTSMHLRREALDRVGAWDPHNVTEDADLGIRLRRYGYTTLLLDSVTLEEANSDFVNWIKQRSRWYKGYLQTWLVHMRSPSQLRRELGTGAFVRFNAIIGLTPVLALGNPVFWLLTALWFTAKPAFIEAVFPPWLYFPGMLCMVLGNFSILYVTLLAIRRTRQPELSGAVLLMPLYWVMMAIAALKAFVQLTLAPSFWEKTAHGLDTRETESPPVAVPGGVM